MTPSDKISREFKVVGSGVQLCISLQKMAGVQRPVKFRVISVCHYCSWRTLNLSPPMELNILLVWRTTYRCAHNYPLRHSDTVTHLTAYHRRTDSVFDIVFVYYSVLTVLNRGVTGWFWVIVWERTTEKASIHVSYKYLCRKKNRRMVCSFPGRVYDVMALYEATHIVCALITW